jgi:hypothetical protein
MNITVQGFYAISFEDELLLLLRVNSAMLIAVYLYALSREHAWFQGRHIDRRNSASYSQGSAKKGRLQ